MSKLDETLAAIAERQLEEQRAATALAMKRQRLVDALDDAKACAWKDGGYVIVHARKWDELLAAREALR